MTHVEKVEREIEGLSLKDLAEFRQWFAEFDATAWDRQLEADVAAGVLDRFADEALTEHRAGKARPI